jgi:hypothetical protein
MAKKKKPVAGKAVVVSRTLAGGQKIRIPVRVKKAKAGGGGKAQIAGAIESRAAVRARTSALRTFQARVGNDGGTWLKMDWLKLTPNSVQDRINPIAREVKKVLASLKKQLG